jgi:hypothetical protein
MSVTPLVSIIIPTYNAKQYLGGCISSVLGSDYSNFELLLVDNCSTDGSVGLVRKLFEGEHRLRIIQNAFNYGHAGGCNAGASEARGEYLAFLDSDVEVTARWLQELVDVMNSEKEIAIAQCKLITRDRSTLWGSGGFIDRCGQTFLYNYGERDGEDSAGVMEIFNPVGAGFLIRRDVFEKSGGYDASFFVYHDDVDLGWRVRLMKWRIVAAPQSTVYHMMDLHGPPKKPVSERILAFHSAKNRLMVLIKNYEMKNLIRYVPLRLSVDILSASDSWTLLARLKAVLWVLTNFRQIYEKRVQVQRRRSISDGDIMRHMVGKSLLLQYGLLWALSYRRKTQTRFFPLFVNLLLERGLLGVEDDKSSCAKKT